VKSCPNRHEKGSGDVRTVLPAGTEARPAPAVRRGVAASPAPAPSWLARQGARLLFALSLFYFLATLLTLIDLAHQAVTIGRLVFYMANWIGPLWPGALLLFASLALDRLDRWLATVRPYSG